MAAAHAHRHSGHTALAGRTSGATLRELRRVHVSLPNTPNTLPRNGNGDWTVQLGWTKWEVTLWFDRGHFITLLTSTPVLFSPPRPPHPRSTDRINITYAMDTIDFDFYIGPDSGDLLPPPEGLFDFDSGLGFGLPPRYRTPRPPSEPIVPLSDSTLVSPRRANGGLGRERTPNVKFVAVVVPIIPVSPGGRQVGSRGDPKD